MIVPTLDLLWQGPAGRVTANPAARPLRLACWPYGVPLLAGPAAVAAVIAWAAEFGRGATIGGAFLATLVTTGHRGGVDPPAARPHGPGVRCLHRRRDGARRVRPHPRRRLRTLTDRPRRRVDPPPRAPRARRCGDAARSDVVRPRVPVRGARPRRRAGRRPRCRRVAADQRPEPGALDRARDTGRRRQGDRERTPARAHQRLGRDRRGERLRERALPPHRPGRRLREHPLPRRVPEPLAQRAGEDPAPATTRRHRPSGTR